MDYSRYQSENVVHVITGDQAVYATEDEYRAWDSGDSCFGDGPTNYSYQERQSQSRSGSEPPNKKTKGSQDSAATSRSRAIGKMFFKTKLCCKFRNGTCPYVTNCNFAHSVEELRRPPPNWQEIVAAHEEERAASSEPREEFQIPAVVGCSGESQRSYKGRHCKKFYTEEGCPYGDSCTFVHDEQSKNRESVAISLGPGGYSGSGGGSGGVTTSGGNGGGGNMQNIKPSNWKTRICNKWEITGYCPFGNKCHFAHGAAELHRYGGGLMEGEAKDGNSTPADSKQGTSTPKMPADSVTASTAVPHPDVYHLGVPSQRSSIVLQRPGIRAHQKWKGPNKISKIYGDWIDDLE